MGESNLSKEYYVEVINSYIRKLSMIKINLINWLFLLYKQESTIYKKLT